jgi:hypothetical protein
MATSNEIRFFLIRNTFSLLVANKICKAKLELNDSEIEFVVENDVSFKACQSEILLLSTNGIKATGFQPVRFRVMYYNLFHRKPYQILSPTSRRLDNKIPLQSYAR